MRNSGYCPAGWFAGRIDTSSNGLRVGRPSAEDDHAPSMARQPPSKRQFRASKANQLPPPSPG